MILVLGSTGFLGQEVCKKLTQRKIEFIKTSLSLGVDLRDIQQTKNLFTQFVLCANDQEKIVINCASWVGGIQYGQKFPVQMFVNNLRMVVNILQASNSTGVDKFINPISNCVYPGKSTLFKEDEIWDGSMHQSVQVYGFVRKAFIIGAYAYMKQFQNKIYNLVLSNMYGPNDHFDQQRSHALGALIMKIVNAKINNLSQVIVWGTGNPVRQWLHVSDGAQALIRAIDMPFQDNPVNIGVSKGVSVRYMAELIKDIVGYTGKLTYDQTKPDGAPYKTVDGSLGQKLMGWKPQTNFQLGVKETIDWYLRSINERSIIQ